MAVRPPETGCYDYRLNDAPAAVTEHWQRIPLGPGRWRVESSRSAADIEIDVTALEEQGLVTRFEVQWRDAREHPLQAEYQLMPDCVQVRRRIGPESSEVREIPYSNETGAPLLFPLMRIFAGPLIARLLHSKGKRAVVLPSIARPADRSTLLLPVVSEREARVTERGAQLQMDGSHYRATRCEYLGDQYGPGSEFWLDEDERLLRYLWQQSPGQHWDVRMRRLVFPAAQ